MINLLKKYQSGAKQALIKEVELMSIEKCKEVIAVFHNRFDEVGNIVYTFTLAGLAEKMPEDEYNKYLKQLEKFD